MNTLNHGNGIGRASRDAQESQYISLSFDKATKHSTEAAQPLYAASRPQSAEDSSFGDPFQAVEDDVEYDVVYDRIGGLEPLAQQVTPPPQQGAPPPVQAAASAERPAPSPGSLPGPETLEMGGDSPADEGAALSPSSLPPPSRSKGRVLPGSKSVRDSDDGSSNGDDSDSDSDSSDLVMRLREQALLAIPAAAPGQLALPPLDAAAPQPLPLPEVRGPSHPRSRDHQGYHQQGQQARPAAQGSLAHQARAGAAMEAAQAPLPGASLPPADAALAIVPFLEREPSGDGMQLDSALQKPDRTLDLLERFAPAMDRFLGMESQIQEVIQMKGDLEEAVQLFHANQEGHAIVRAQLAEIHQAIAAADGNAPQGHGDTTLANPPPPPAAPLPGPIQAIDSLFQSLQHHLVEHERLQPTLGGQMLLGGAPSQAQQPPLPQTLGPRELQQPATAAPRPRAVAIVPQHPGSEQRQQAPTAVARPRAVAIVPQRQSNQAGRQPEQLATAAARLQAVAVVPQGQSKQAGRQPEQLATVAARPRAGAVVPQSPAPDPVPAAARGQTSNQTAAAKVADPTPGTGNLPVAVARKGSPAPHASRSNTPAHELGGARLSQGVGAREHASRVQSGNADVPAATTQPPPQTGGPWAGEALQQEASLPSSAAPPLPRDPAPAQQNSSAPLASREQGAAVQGAPAPTARILEVSRRPAAATKGSRDAEPTRKRSRSPSRRAADKQGDRRQPSSRPARSPSASPARGHSERDPKRQRASRPRDSRASAERSPKGRSRSKRARSPHVSPRGRRRGSSSESERRPRAQGRANGRSGSPRAGREGKRRREQSPRSPQRASRNRDAQAARKPRESDAPPGGGQSSAKKGVTAEVRHAETSSDKHVTSPGTEQPASSLTPAAQAEAFLSSLQSSAPQGTAPATSQPNVQQGGTAGGAGKGVGSTAGGAWTPGLFNFGSRLPTTAGSQPPLPPGMGPFTFTCGPSAHQAPGGIPGPSPPPYSPPRTTLAPTAPPFFPRFQALPKPQPPKTDPPAAPSRTPSKPSSAAQAPTSPISKLKQQLSSSTPTASPPLPPRQATARETARQPDTAGEPAPAADVSPPLPVNGRAPAAQASAAEAPPPPSPETLRAPEPQQERPSTAVDAMPPSPASWRAPEPQGPRVTTATDALPPSPASWRAPEPQGPRTTTATDALPPSPATWRAAEPQEPRAFRGPAREAWNAVPGDSQKKKGRHTMQTFSRGRGRPLSGRPVPPQPRPPAPPVDISAAQLDAGDGPPGFLPSSQAQLAAATLTPSLPDPLVATAPTAEDSTPQERATSGSEPGAVVAEAAATATAKQQPEREVDGEEGSEDEQGSADEAVRAAKGRDILAEARAAALRGATRSPSILGQATAGASAPQTSGAEQATAADEQPQLQGAPAAGQPTAGPAKPQPRAKGVTSPRGKKLVSPQQARRREGVVAGETDYESDESFEVELDDQGPPEVGAPVRPSQPATRGVRPPAARNPLQVAEAAQRKATAFTSNAFSWRRSEAPAAAPTAAPRVQRPVPPTATARSQVRPPANPAQPTARPLAATRVAGLAGGVAGRAAPAGTLTRRAAPHGPPTAAKKGPLSWRRGEDAAPAQPQVPQPAPEATTRLQREVSSGRAGSQEGSGGGRSGSMASQGAGGETSSRPRPPPAGEAGGGRAPARVANSNPPVSSANTNPMASAGAVGPRPPVSAAAANSHPAMPPMMEAEHQLASLGEMDSFWQMLPWRCSVCCMGFPSQMELLQHFASQDHCHFARLALQHVFGRDIITLMPNRSIGRQEYVENSYPLPCFNRKGLEVGTASSEVTAWRCQVCHEDFRGAEFFRHQFSQRHLNQVQGQIQGLSQMMMFNPFTHFQ